jgi:hypothetical protein
MALRYSDALVGAMRRGLYKDCGSISLAPAITKRLYLEYRNHPN